MASPVVICSQTAARPAAARATVQRRRTPRRRGVGVAVIGLGYWGPNLVRNFHEVIGDDLHACCDREESRANAIRARYPRLRATYDVGEILADNQIDAVAIATPVATHYPLAKAALEAGKSVLIEKPMTADVAQAEELVDLAHRKGLVLMVDHVFVYSPPVRKIKELLEAGELGRLLYIDSVRINLGLFQRDVNVVWDLAPHDLSIVDYLIGRTPKSVAAFGSVHTGSGHEDVAYLNLDFGDGLIASFHVNWLSPVKIRYTMLGGSKKGLVYNDLDPVETIKVYDSGISVRQDDLEDRRNILVDYRTGDVWSPRLEPAEPLRAVVRHFVECVAGDKTPLTDGQAGLRVVRVLDAAQRSIKAQGGRITL
jgi:predicted dehydrogenase